MGQPEKKETGLMPGILRGKPWKCRIRLCKPDREVGVRRIEVNVPGKIPEAIQEFTIECRTCHRQIKVYGWEPEGEK